MALDSLQAQQAHHRSGWWCSGFKGLKNCEQIWCWTTMALTHLDEGACMRLDIRPHPECQIADESCCSNPASDVLRMTSFFLSMSIVSQSTGLCCCCAL